MKCPQPPTDEQMLLLRNAVSRILEMPQDGLGVVIAIGFATDDGDDTSMRPLTLGLSQDFAAFILRSAAITCATCTPTIKGEYAPGKPD